MHLFSHNACCMYSPSNSSWLDHPDVVRIIDHEAPRYVVFSILLLLDPLWSENLSQHPILEHPQPILCCPHGAFSCR
jgi:hypothetical protein